MEYFKLWTICNELQKIVDDFLIETRGDRALDLELSDVLARYSLEDVLENYSTWEIVECCDTYDLLDEMREDDIKDYVARNYDVSNWVYASLEWD